LDDLLITENTAIDEQANLAIFANWRMLRKILSRSNREAA
jgi:hypothetical protein